MKILIFNWRDIKNPISGGAEILTYEMAVRWVKSGHQVTWFTSEFPGAKNEEILDGIRIIRHGKPDLRSLWNSVHYKAYLYYRKFGKGNYDIIVDEIHGMPFFTPLYVKEPVIPLICEVADNIWDRMFPFPWNKIGKFIEKVSLQLLYKNKHFLTISQSTKEDLIRNGVNKKAIAVLPMGINRITVILGSKEKDPTIIFVARINKMKGIEDAVMALSYVVREYPTAKLWIIGRGEDVYLIKLKKYIRELNLSNHVRFWNFVSQKKKFELMAKAWLLIAPSAREGFGLTVPEAGFVKTPAIVYNVPGLKEIVNKNNGILLKKNTPEELAKMIIYLFKNKKLYNKLRIGALMESKQYDWENTARVSLQVLEKI